MIGTTLAHFEITAKLGEGGMGEVYRARDTRLDREVAIKVLPEDFAGDKERLARFQREAKTLASLNHPNVAGIYAIDHEGDSYFLTLELVPGEDLAARLARGPLPLEEALNICTQMADGLEAAHEAGIVHRDLKPANVRITPKGMVKLLDFGLAKPFLSLPDGECSPEADTQTLFATEAGRLVGTPAYMSPEQARGEMVDRRTDIWSFGCLLFECLAGVTAFEGDSLPDVLAAIISGQPDWSRLPRVPEEVMALLRGTLAKDLVQRPANIGEVRARLREALGADVPPPSARKPASVESSEKSIAVLPFANRNPGSEDDYFSDGLSEELINALSKVSGLKVTARSSAFQFRGQEFDARVVGRKLGVEKILEGSVRIAGGRLRITTQLVDCNDGYQIWSERYDLEMKDVFETQDRITLAIVEHLQIRLGSGAAEQLVPSGPDNLEAYHLLLKARQARDKMTPAGLAQAVSLYQQAIRTAPDYAAAHSEMAMAHVLAAYWTGMDSGTFFAHARIAAERAIALDARVADAYSALGTVHTFHDLDWTAAERMFTRAVELNPNNAYIHYWRSMFLAISRRDGEAVTAAQRSHDLDPLSSIINGSYGQILYMTGRAQQAVQVLENAVALEPGDYFLHHALGWAYRETGDHDKAIESGRQAVEISDGIGWVQMVYALTCYRFGDREEAGKLFDELQRRSSEEYIWLTSFVFMHLIRGEIDDAVRQLRAARDARDPLYCWFGCVSRGSASLELPSDPRIDAILEESGLT